MKLGERIKEMREEKGLAQEQLAQLLNVKQGTISGWEINRRQPSLEMLKKLSEVLECDVRYLLGVIDF